MRAGRWSTRGIRPSWTGGRPRICACPSSSATPRRACTSGSWRSAGSRLVFVGAALGQALAAGASHGVGRLRRVGVGAGKRAGRFRPGQGRDRRSRTRGAFPGGVVPVFEHALGGRPSRRDLGMRVPGFAVDLRAHGHGAQGGGVRQRHRRGPSRVRTARPPGPACSPCSARITGSSRGSATRIPATGRAV